jgi:hypothetical protein
MVQELIRYASIMPVDHRAWAGCPVTPKTFAAMHALVRSSEVSIYSAENRIVNAAYAKEAPGLPYA